MKVTWLNRLDELAEPWERLAERTPLPFVRHAWFSAWWAAFGKGRRLRVCALWDGDELAAAFPLYQVGSRLHSLANEHTPAFRPLARDERALAELVGEVVAVASGELAAPALPAGDPALGLLAAESEAARRLTLVQPRHTSPIVEAAAGLDRKARKDTERRRRKLESERGALVRPLGVPLDLGRELEEGYAVEASGWKGRSAIAGAAETRAFYAALARAFAEQDRLRLSTISVDGRAIAFDYCLVDHKRLWILKGGYDDRFRGYSPGVVLTLAQIQSAFELGLEAVELLGDEAPWKLKFSTTAREHRDFRSYGRRPPALGRYAYRRFVRPPLHRAYRRVRPSRG